MVLGFPHLGFGAGFRPPHRSRLLTGGPTQVDWLEILAENYLDFEDGRERHATTDLEKLRRDYPLVFHGVSLSIGSTDPLNTSHLRRVRRLLDCFEATWYSDHLCWTGVGGTNLHDLLPLPYTEEALQHVAGRVQKVQDFLGRRILLENLSSYVTFQDDEMPEWEFLSEIARRADCGLLLDINNVYVSSRNHGFEPLEYLRAVDPSRVVQIHLAGHNDKGEVVVDTHDNYVREEVWDLFEWACQHWGPRSTMIEWDERVPVWEELEGEVGRARVRAERGRDDAAQRTPASL